MGSPTLCSSNCVASSRSHRALVTAKSEALKKSASGGLGCQLLSGLLMAHRDLGGGFHRLGANGGSLCNKDLGHPNVKRQSWSLCLNSHLIYDGVLSNKGVSNKKA